MGKENLRYFVSSDSARKLKCLSSARLGSEPSQLGSAKAGKFQFGLITKKYALHYSQTLSKIDNSLKKYHQKYQECRFQENCPPPPLFDIPVYPISNKGGTLFPPSAMCPLGFSEIAKALQCKISDGFLCVFCFARARRAQ